MEFNFNVEQRISGAHPKLEPSVEAEIQIWDKDTITGELESPSVTCWQYGAGISFTR